MMKLLLSIPLLGLAVVPFALAGDGDCPSQAKKACGQATETVAQKGECPATKAACSGEAKLVSDEGSKECRIKASLAGCTEGAQAVPVSDEGKSACSTKATLVADGQSCSAKAAEGACASKAALVAEQGGACASMAATTVADEGACSKEKAAACATAVAMPATCSTVTGTAVAVLGDKACAEKAACTEKTSCATTVSLVAATPEASMQALTHELAAVRAELALLRAELRAMREHKAGTVSVVSAQACEPKDCAAVPVSVAGACATKAEPVAAKACCKETKATVIQVQ